MPLVAPSSLEPRDAMPQPLPPTPPPPLPAPPPRQGHAHVGRFPVVRLGAPACQIARQPPQRAPGVRQSHSVSPFAGMAPRLARTRCADASGPLHACLAPPFSPVPQAARRTPLLQGASSSVVQREAMPRLLQGASFSPPALPLPSCSARAQGVALGPPPRSGSVGLHGSEALTLASDSLPRTPRSAAHASLRRAGCRRWCRSACTRVPPPQPHPG